MSRRLRPWVVGGLLVLAGVVVLAAASLPYLPLMHGTTAHEVERLAAWLEVEPGTRVADVGAGDGTFAVALAHRVGPIGSGVCDRARCRTSRRTFDRRRQTRGSRTSR